MGVFVGSDPGKEGWISVIDAVSGELVFDAEQPLIGSRDTAGDTYDRSGMVRLVAQIDREHDVLMWAIEQQSPGRGAGQRAAKSMIIQMQSYGFWLGVLSASGIRHVEVLPREWRKKLNVAQPRYPKEKAPSCSKKSKEGKVIWKDYSAREAKRLRKQRKEGLERAVRRAQQLHPEVDFRRNARCKVPHPDKAISVLLAHYARTEYSPAGAADPSQTDLFKEPV